ncbi:head completion/stabilization protein [Pseudomonas capeferrum]|uniref:head completion/stabilization protein n=1 Tax=Pseudomonas capeferrum TaxID=1495066 RepID=UPI0015E3D30E|nr:head completion/stabilization protein [Pseudomonas capeferrum]MBA1205225.1 head completion/stabilization protein [Pseudomonas capeferrum]
MHDNLETTTRSATGKILSSDDPFWPRIDLSSLRARLGLNDSVSDTRLEVAARAAAIKAASEFACWRRSLRARGYRCLSDLEGHEQGRALSTCYLRQVEACVGRTLSSGVLGGERQAWVTEGETL